MKDLELSIEESKKVYNNKRTIMVNGVEVTICDLRCFPIRTRKHWLPYGWEELVFTNWAFKWPDTTRDLLRAAGHDANKIDLAIPQPWGDRWQKRTGKWPRCCWTYEGENIMGEPLFYDKVQDSFRYELNKVWRDDYSPASGDSS